MQKSSFGESWRITPGTWIKLKEVTAELGEWGRVLKVEGYGTFIIETDACAEKRVHRDDFKIKQDRAAPHRWFPMRKTLPYGQYRYEDGSRVLFNHDYEPLLRVLPSGQREPCQPDDLVLNEREEWFYGGDSGKAAPWESAASLVEAVRRLAQ